MRFLTLRCVLGLGLLCAGPALSQTWSEPIPLGRGILPDLDVNPATGTLYIVHHNNGVIYTEVDFRGNILRQETVNVAQVDNPGVFGHGATIAFDPVTQRAHLCFRENNIDDYYSIFYTRRLSNGSWSSPIEFVDNLRRAYVVRMEVDSEGIAHVVHGSAEDEEDVGGIMTYIRLNNGSVTRLIDEFNVYRVDDRLEISVDNNNVIHIIASTPDDAPNGSPVTYFRSNDGGETLRRIADIHASSATGRNGNADVYADMSNNVHFVYGSGGFPNGEGPRNVHYARYSGNTKVRDVIVTGPGEIEEWRHGLGIGSVAASDDGKYVIVAYNKGDGVETRARLSTDGGATWSNPVTLGGGTEGSEGRQKQVVRAWQNTFYLVYPAGQQIFLRSLKAANSPPKPNAGGPYTGVEGTPIRFDASKSTGDGPLVLYKWDWTGNGVWDDSSANAVMMHAYADDFSGNAKLEVKDNTGLRSQTQVQVTVTNVAPIAEAGGPYAGAVNKSVALSGSATDAGSGDVLTYRWDLNNDGTFETNGKNVNATFNSPGTKTVRLQVRDDDGGTGEDTATIEVGTGVPVVSSIPDQTVREGQPFTSIQLDNYVADADHQPGQLRWSASGHNQLSVVIQNRVATVAVPDSEWVGSELITFTVRDPENNAASTNARFTVTSVNDRPRVTAIPAQSVNEGTPFEKIRLDDYVFDPDHDDAQISWSVQGAVHLTVSIINRIAAVAPADSEWAGSERINFVARDPEGAIDSTRVRFTIAAVNDPPRFAPIPEQIANRGSSFPVLDLADYLHDADNPVTGLHITISGQVRLRVNLNRLLVTVTPPNPTWIGSELITITARDAGNATGFQQVKFSVIDVNTPPQWVNRRDYAFNEDDTLEIPLEQLRARVTDAEDAAENFVFSLAGNQNVRYFTTTTHFNLRATRDWNGVETVQLVVGDGRGMTDSVSTQITVRPVTDPLTDFRCITPVGLFYTLRPDSIVFIWQTTEDVDNPGSEIDYLWTLSLNQEFTRIIDQKPLRNKTSTSLLITGNHPEGKYFWKVLALSTSGLSKESRNIGGFELPRKIAVQEKGNSNAPESFALKPNYPNPFNPQTTIAFGMARRAHALVKIYDVEGKVVSTLVDGLMSPGNHEVVWNAQGLASGLYFAELVVQDEGTVVYQARQKMSLVR